MNYKEYGGGYEPGDSVSIYDDVVVESEVEPKKELIREKLRKVIQSHNKTVADEVIQEETIQALNLDDDDFRVIGERSVMKEINQGIGASKRKGIARITEATPQAEFNFMAQVPLNEAALLVLDSGMSIPLDRANINDISISHAHYTAKHKAKMEEMENAERQRTKAVTHLKTNMEPGKVISDYDNGEGVAEI